MKRVLMVAYHFPPLAGSSGIQRTLRFVQQLPQFGWQPLVLTTTTNVYERVTEDLNPDVPDGTVVRRAFALDTARHLSWRGRYLGRLALPDRFMTWKFDGVRQGMQMIRKFQPDVIWSTYPVATAHVIGAELHRRSGIPWVADFRDPMAQDGYPSDRATWLAFESVEKRAMEFASRSFFTTPSAAHTYRARYPAAADRIALLPNGYDEASFAEAESEALAARQYAGSMDPATRASPAAGASITLLHSGIVYPQERDPTQLFKALERLQAAGTIGPNQLRLKFRASVHENLILRLAAEHGVQAMIEVAPAIGYRSALAEMLNADGLLVMQASNCNEQVPAKVYEYLRARRPMLGLADPSGDTAAVMRDSGIDTLAALESADAIEDLLPRFLNQIRSQTAPLPSETAVAQSSRLARTRVLAAEFDTIARPR